MKRIFLSLIFIFAFCIGTFAQTNEILPCPTLSVMGPPGIPQPDEPITFTAQLSEEAQKYDLKYRWSVSSGTIVEGQGTLSLKILQKDLGETPTVTIEIKALPTNCSTIASETIPVCDCVQVIQVDEFSISASRINKAALDNFATELQKNPNAQGYIIELFDGGVSPKAVEAKNRQIYSYLTKMRLDKSRFTILNGLAKLNDLADKNLTQFFIAPAGATPPYCADCITAKAQ